MELWQIAIPVEDAADEGRVLRLVRKLRVPLNPCAGDPRFEVDAAGRRRLLVLVTAGMQQELRRSGRAFEIVRDFADAPDPRRYVSQGDRFADELARLRAKKDGR